MRDLSAMRRENFRALLRHILLQRYSTLAKGVYRSSEKCEDVRNDKYKHVIYYIMPKIFKYLVK